MYTQTLFDYNFAEVMQNNEISAAEYISLCFCGRSNNIRNHKIQFRY